MAPNTEPRIFNSTKKNRPIGDFLDFLVVDDVRTALDTLEDADIICLMPKPPVFLVIGASIVLLAGGTLWYVQQQRQEAKQNIEKLKEEIKKATGSEGSLAERALNMCQDSVDEKLAACQKFEIWKVDILVGYTNTATKEGDAFEQQIYGPNNKCLGTTAGEKEPLRVKGELIDSQEQGTSTYEVACSVTCFHWDCPNESKKATETPLGSWEFLDVDAGWQKISTLPYGHRVHLIAASNGTPDMRTFLPIRVEFTVDGTIVWQTSIAGSPNAVCRDATGCSTDGPTVQSSWQGKKIRLNAYGKDGQLLASYSEN